MTNKKISALIAATVPLVGTELVPIVQSGATDNVTVANLTAGRAVSALSYTASAGYTATANGFNTLTDTSEVTFGSDSGTGGVGAYYNSAYDGVYFYNRTGGTPQFGIKRTGDVGLLTGNLVQGTAAKGINFTANTPSAGMTSQLLNWYEEGNWTPSDQSGAGLTFTVGSAKYTRMGRQVTCMCSMSYPVTANTAGAVIGGLPFASGSNGGGSIQGLFAARTFSIVCTGLYGGAGSTSVVIDKNNGAAIALNVDLTGATMYFTLTYFIS